MSPAALGPPTAAHLILGRSGIRQTGINLPAGTNPFNVIPNAAIKQAGRVVAHPNPLHGDPPIELPIGGFAIELELHGDIVLRAAVRADGANPDSRKDRIAVLYPPAIQTIVASQVVAILGIAVGGVVRKDVGLGIAVQILVNRPAPLDRLKLRFVVILKPELQD